MSVHFEIRSCRASECAVVLTLWNAHHASDLVDRIEDVTRLVDEFDGHLLVATCDDRIIGAIIAGWDGWRGQLHHLVVLPEHRRRGVARALVSAAHRLLTAKGARRISVLVERNNPDAIAFYNSLRSLGYTVDTRMQRYVRTTQAHYDERPAAESSGEG